jgi:hypothetical protein
MAQEHQNTPSQKPPPVDSPEPDIDVLLAELPEFAHIFGKGTQSGNPAPKEPAQGGEAAEAPASEDESIPGVPAAEPLEEPEAEPSETPQEEPEPAVADRDRDAVQKRIDKLVAQKKAAEENASRLETELAELRQKHATPAISVTPTADSPLANVFSMDELAKRDELARHARSWAVRHRDGGEVPMPNGEVKFMTSDEVNDMWVRADEMVSTHIPRRAQFLQSKSQWDQAAAAAYPVMFRQGSEDYHLYLSVLSEFPAALTQPGVSMAIGDMIAGRRARLAREKARSNGNGQAPPLLQKAAPASAPRVPKSRKLSGSDLTPIATDPHGDTLDRFVAQLFDEAAAKRAQH